MLHANIGVPCINKTKLRSSALGKIKDSATNKWPTIIDLYDNATPILLIDNFKLGAKWQAAMRRCHP